MRRAHRKPELRNPDTWPNHVRFADIDKSDVSDDDEVYPWFHSLITLSSVRDDLGVFGDESQDAMIRGFIESAIAIVERILSMPLTNRAVNDYYLEFGKRMILSQPVTSRPRSGSRISIDSIVWRNDAGVEQTVSATDLGGIILDESGAWPIAVMPDSLAEISLLSEDAWAPVRITYEGAYVDALHPAFDVVRQALKWQVNQLYFHRAAPDLGDVTSAHINRLLNPWRSQIAVG